MQVRYNITMDKDVSDELETLARELGEKKSRIIEKALIVYFDLLDLKLAQKRLKDATASDPLRMSGKSLISSLVIHG